MEARQKQLRNKMKRYALGDKTALSTTKTKGKLRAHDEWEADMFDPESVPDLPSVPGDESEAEDSTWSFDASNVDFDSAAFHSLPYVPPVVIWSFMPVTSHHYSHERGQLRDSARNTR